MVDHNSAYSSSDSPPLVEGRLNIFALPTRTSLLFGLIILVVLLPVLASMIEDTPLCEPFILVLMFLLPLRSFLRQPDTEIRRKKLTEPGEEYVRLIDHIGRLSRRADLRRTPYLLLSPKPGSLFTFGTFTRRYLVISADRAHKLQADLDSLDRKHRDGAEAMLLHELSHFANRDIVPAFFARSLLGVTIAFMTLNMFVNLLNPFLYNTLIRFFDFASLWPPEMFELLQEIDPEVTQLILDPPFIPPETWLKYELYLFTVFWPLIAGAVALLLFFWPALLRTRELYADARVAQWQKTIRFIQEELSRESMRKSLQPLSASTGLLEHLRQPLAFLSAKIEKQSWLKRFFDLFSFHPSSSIRRACLAAPENLYGSKWAIAATAGFTVVLLNLTLGSLFISRYIRGPNATIPFVLGFIIISLSLLPTLCASTEVSSLHRKSWIIVLFFTGIKLVPQYIAAGVMMMTIVVDPTIIDQAAYTLAGAFGPDLPSLDVPIFLILWLYVLGPAILFTFIMPITLIIFLRLDSYLKRQVLTWYGAPVLHQHPLLFLWGLTTWLALILWFVVLPFYNVFAAPTAHTLLDIWILARMSLTLLVSAVAVVFLGYTHQRYAQRCPQCQQLIPDPYFPGKCCPDCRTMLHAWLVADELPQSTAP